MKSRGRLGNGTAVFFADGNASEVVVAEGPETGLSIAACTGLEVRCTLGSLKRYTPLRGKTLIAAADDDPWGSPSARGLLEALRNWKKRGARVYVAHPWPIRREDKSDFNDLLKAQGPDAVRSRIASAGPRPAPPGDTSPKDVAGARSWLLDAVRRFFNG